MPEYIYVAFWTFADGHTMLTMSRRNAWNTYVEAPEKYAAKRIERWNRGGNRGDRSGKRIALSFEMAIYTRHSSGSVPAVGSSHMSVARPSTGQYVSATGG